MKSKYFVHINLFPSHMINCIFLCVILQNFIRNVRDVYYESSKYIIFFDILLYFCIVLVSSRFCITFFRDLNAMRMKNCSLHFFRSSSEPNMLMNNATQNVTHDGNSTVLKLFQGCIKEREPYSTIKLSCTGYGNLFENIFLPSPSSTPFSGFARSINLLLKSLPQFFATRDRSIFLQFAAADIPFTKTRE